MGNEGQVRIVRTAVGQRESRLGRSTMETNHVNQDDGEVGGVSGDGTPRNGLRLLAGIPGGILARAGDGEGQGGSSEEEGCGEGGEGTHHFGWEGAGREKGEGKGRRRKSEGEVGLFQERLRTQPPSTWACRARLTVSRRSP